MRKREEFTENEIVTCLEKLKCCLDKISVYSEDELNIYLDEHGLDSNSEYNENKMYIRLYQTVIEILESLVNNTDLLMEYYSEFTSTTAAVNHIQTKINFLKGGIDSFISSKPIIVTSIKLAYKIIENGYLHCLFRVGRNKDRPNRRVWYFDGRSEIQLLVDEYIAESKNNRRYVSETSKDLIRAAYEMRNNKEEF